MKMNQQKEDKAIAESQREQFLVNMRNKRDDERRKAEEERAEMRDRWEEASAARRADEERKKALWRQARETKRSGCANFIQNKSGEGSPSVKPAFFTSGAKGSSNRRIKSPSRKRSGSKEEDIVMSARSPTSQAALMDRLATPSGSRSVQKVKTRDEMGVPSAPMGRRWSSGRGEAPAFLSAAESTLYDVDSAVAKRSMSKKRHSAPPKIPACANHPTTASTYGSWNSERDTGKFFDLASSPSPRLVKKRHYSDSKPRRATAFSPSTPECASRTTMASMTQMWHGDVHGHGVSSSIRVLGFGSCASRNLDPAARAEASARLGASSDRQQQPRSRSMPPAVGRGRPSSLTRDPSPAKPIGRSSMERTTSRSKSQPPRTFHDPSPNLTLTSTGPSPTSPIPTSPVATLKVAATAQTAKTATSVENTLPPPPVSTVSLADKAADSAKVTPNSVAEFEPPPPPAPVSYDTSDVMSKDEVLAGNPFLTALSGPKAQETLDKHLKENPRSRSQSPSRSAATSRSHSPSAARA
mmetsp:Transcript_11154/g.29872  ORF Transcript_11154/g.29872 Transcript_11154/m.29872 type:complete len:526 (+) Transcript_11154:944-2521(+)